MKINDEELEAIRRIQVDQTVNIEVAVRKQIPAKPLPEERYYGIGRCPRCSVVFLDRTTGYCGNCGQALDWGECGEEAHG